MKPPRSCCGVTGTRSSPAESKTLDETKRKEQIPSGRRMCVGCRHALRWRSKLEEEFPLFMFCTFQRMDQLHLRPCAVFLTLGVVCEENSAGKTWFLKLQLERMSWPGLRCSWCCNVIQLSQFDLSWSLKRNDPVAAFGGSPTVSWLSV